MTTWRTALIGLTLLYSANSVAAPSWPASDPVQTAGSSAVGRLLVYGQRCQLVLVRFDNQTEARVAVTNRHCIDQLLPQATADSYEANSLQGHFYNGQEVLYRKLTIREHGADILGGDWAIVVLDEPIALADMHSFAITQPPPKKLPHERIARYYPLSATAAAPVGHCQFDALLQATNGDVVRVTTCPLQEGDSGSAYIGTSSIDDLPILMGIVKAKHKKNAGTGYYIPLSSFFQPLVRALKAHNQ